MLNPAPQEAAPTLELHNFTSLGLSLPILDCITKIGFTRPTPIQREVIPTALRGQDLIGLAQTGSGKTAAFALPLAERLTHGHGLRGLILCPTREIALQTKEFLDLFGQDHKLVTVCLIGGMRIGGQVRELKRRPDIVVATPGRLYDHMQRHHVKLDQIQELVLDEADHMLDMGFLPQIEKILRAVPPKRHTMMFSATMPGPIERLTRRFLNAPVTVDIRPEGKAAVNLEHKLYLVDWANKQDCLIALLRQCHDTTLIFTRMKSDADFVVKVLERAGLEAEAIHSDRSQRERIDALSGLKVGKHRILVATDIASRGIDVPSIRHIINYDIPENVEDYIHRSGRTARAEAEGIVSTIATWQDKARVREIEAVLGKELVRSEAPGVKPYVEFKLNPAHRMGRRR
jgi:ATP-dependent RNA helicase RhlE